MQMFDKLIIFLVLPYAIFIAHFDIYSKKMISFPFAPTFSNSSVNIKEYSTNISKYLFNMFKLKLGAINLRFSAHIDAKRNIRKNTYAHTNYV